MLYEYCLGKVLTDLADNFVQWESITIGSYLLGVGVGVWLYPRLRKTSVFDFLVQVEWLLVTLGLLALPLIWAGHCYYRTLIADYQAVNLGGIRSLSLVLASYQCLPLALGLLSGLELAALLRIAAAYGNLGVFGRLWCCSYLGALAACLLFTYLVMHGYSLITMVLFASLCNFGVGCGLILLTNKSFLGSECRGSRWRFVPLGILPLIWLALAVYKDALFQLHLQNIYYNHLELFSTEQGVRALSFWQNRASYPLVKRIASRYQTIDIVPNISWSAPPGWQQQVGKGFRLYLDHHFQFDSTTEVAYHEILAHVPSVLLRWQAKKVAVLGGGDGLLVRELLKGGDLRLSLVELDPQLLELARQEPLLALNQGSLNRPEVEVIADDALHWLRFQQQHFEGIYMDFPFPYDLNSLRLYSWEFFALVRRSLLPDKGYVVMDVPLKINTPDFEKANKLILSTLQRAGFRSMLGISHEGESFILATVNKVTFNLSYEDFGIELGFLSPQIFHHALAFHPIAAAEQKGGESNSLFKVVMLPFRDLRF